MYRALIIALLLSLNFSHSHAQQFKWSRGFQYPNATTGEKLAGDFQGNIILSGHYGPYQSNGVFIHKYDPAGKLIWTTNYSNATDQRTAVTPSGKIIMSTLETPGYFLTVINADGSECRRKSLMPNSNESKMICDVASAGDEGYYLSGTFFGKFTMGTVQVTADNGEKRVFLARFDSLDKCLWAVSSNAGSATMAERPEIFVDSSGVYMIGQYNAKFGFGSQMITSTEANGFLAKFDHDGQFRWLRRIGDDKGETTVSAVSKDPGGNIFLTGVTGSMSDQCNVLANSIYALKLNASGECVWGKSISSTRSFSAGSVDAGSGNIYVTGSFLGNCIFETGSLLGEFEPFIVRFSNEGSLQWFTGCGGYKESFGTSKDLLFLNDRLFVTGVLDGRMNFGGNELYYPNTGLFLTAVANAPGVGLQEHTFDKISLFPNPSSERILIDIEHEQVNDLEAVSLDGRRFTLPLLRDHHNVVNTADISSLSSGVYLLEIKSQDQIFRRKIVVE
jgi:hypothetical protein